VNLASRLESLNRTLSTNCLTSEIVAERIASDWDMTHRGGQKVKGVADEVNVFELRGRKDSEK
jgi:class 3 adenylate cyclase